MKDRAAFICNLIVRNRGHVYVCGDVNMAADVCDTITSMLAKYLRVSEEDGDEYVKKMRVSILCCYHCLFSYLPSMNVCCCLIYSSFMLFFDPFYLKKEATPPEF